jgi:hypothetical protein
MSLYTPAIYGHQPGPKLPEQDVRQKWAWLPLKSSSGKWIWREYYALLRIYQDKDGKVPITGLYWKIIFTQNEFLVWELKYEQPAPQQSRPPTTGSSVVRKRI